MEPIKSDIIALHGASLTNQGGRPENQDDFGFVDTPLGFLLIVCDGMGGGPGGKTASYIAKNIIAASLHECNSQTPRDKAFTMAVSKANDALNQKMKEVPALVGMGSTLVALLIDSHSALIAHAGDSRCYQMRGKKVIYRSQDHSLVAELVRNKALTEEQARISPQSNVISRGLGSIPNNTPDIEEVTFKKGDRFILCTDGVWGIMPHKDLLMRFAQFSDMSKIDAIAEEINKIGFNTGGNHDNFTLAVVEMDVDSAMKSQGVVSRKIIYSAAAAIVAVLLGLLIASLFNRNKTDDFNGAGYEMDFEEGYDPEGIGIAGDSLDERYLPDDDTIPVDTLWIANKLKELYPQESDSVINKIINIISGKDTTKIDCLKIDPNKILESVPAIKSKKKADTKKSGKKKVATTTPPTTRDVALAIIDKYRKIQNLSCKTSKEVQMRVESEKKTISKTLASLENRVKNSSKSVKNKLAEIKKHLNEDHCNADSQYKKDNKGKSTNRYGITGVSSLYIDKQIERLRELEKELK